MCHLADARPITISVSFTGRRTKPTRYPGGARLPADRISVPTVVVLGGDAVVGRALRLLLRSADCDVRFVAETSSDDPGLLDGVGLLLLAPGLSAERREGLLASIDARASTKKIPILELVDSAQAAQAAAVRSVPWPCRAEELKRRIEAALLAD